MIDLISRYFSIAGADHSPQRYETAKGCNFNKGNSGKRCLTCANERNKRVARLDYTDAGAIKPQACGAAVIRAETRRLTLSKHSAALNIFALTPSPEMDRSVKKNTGK